MAADAAAPECAGRKNRERIMSRDHMVDVDNVHKIFHTRHFLQRHEETNQRVFYRKKTVQAAKHVKFHINRGEVFGLLGPNGAGKTTTVKMISGLVRPSAGAVYVDGLSVERARLKVLRKIGVVLEGTRTSIWPLTPLENLAYYGNLRDVRGSVLKKRSRELLDFIGLTDKMNVQVSKLSRGQKQRLAICIALIADPPVVLLDEPTTGLDVQSSRVIKDKIREMTREQHKSVLVTTHDMHVAQELCDRIGIISNGELVACRPTRELIDLFSDCRFTFTLNRPADIPSLLQVPGVSSADYEPGDGHRTVILSLPQEESARSASLYGITRHFETAGFELHAMNQRKQTLEDVFLRVTSENGPKRN